MRKCELRRIYCTYPSTLLDAAIDNHCPTAPSEIKFEDVSSVRRGFSALSYAIYPRQILLINAANDDGRSSLTASGILALDIYLAFRVVHCQRNCITVDVRRVITWMGPNISIGKYFRCIRMQRHWRCILRCKQSNAKDSV